MCRLRRNKDRICGPNIERIYKSLHLHSALTFFSYRTILYQSITHLLAATSSMRYLLSSEYPSPRVCFHLCGFSMAARSALRPSASTMAFLKSSSSYFVKRCHSIMLAAHCSSVSSLNLFMAPTTNSTPLHPLTMYLAFEYIVQTKVASAVQQERCRKLTFGYSFMAQRTASRAPCLSPTPQNSR